MSLYITLQQAMGLKSETEEASTFRY